MVVPFPGLCKLASHVIDVSSGTVRDRSFSCSPFCTSTCRFPQPPSSSAPASTACMGTTLRRWTSWWVSGTGRRDTGSPGFDSRGQPHAAPRPASMMPQVPALDKPPTKARSALPRQCESPCFRHTCVSWHIRFRVSSGEHRNAREAGLPGGQHEMHFGEQRETPWKSSLSIHSLQNTEMIETLLEIEIVLNEIQAHRSVFMQA